MLYVMPQDRFFNKGEEVKFTYPRDKSQLNHLLMLRNFGFVVENNKYASMSIGLSSDNIAVDDNQKLICQTYIKCWDDTLKEAGVVKTYGYKINMHQINENLLNLIRVRLIDEAMPYIIAEDTVGAMKSLFEDPVREFNVSRIYYKFMSSSSSEESVEHMKQHLIEIAKYQEEVEKDYNKLFEESETPTPAYQIDRQSSTILDMRRRSVVFNFAINNAQVSQKQTLFSLERGIHFQYLDTLKLIGNPAEFDDADLIFDTLGGDLSHMDDYPTQEEIATSDEQP